MIALARGIFGLCVVLAASAALLFAIPHIATVLEVLGQTADAIASVLGVGVAVGAGVVIVALEAALYWRILTRDEDDTGIARLALGLLNGLHFLAAFVLLRASDTAESGGVLADVGAVFLSATFVPVVIEIATRGLRIFMNAVEHYHPPD